MESKKKPLIQFTIGVSHLQEGNFMFPTHSFENIKDYRKKVFEIVKHEFIKERKIKNLPITENDFYLLVDNWFDSELKEISRIENLELTRTDQIELKKYKEYINDCINQLKQGKEKKETNKEGLTSCFSQVELETIFDKLVNAKWIKGRKSDFVAIFTPETLPANWQPIEFIKKWGTNPHASAIATLVKYISPKTGNKIIWDGYFTFKGKPIEIPTNNRNSISIVNDLDRLLK